MDNSMIVITVISLFLLSMVEGHRRYTKLIPNGRRVPNPCTETPDDVWLRVGHKHLDKTGGKEKLQFGKDFHDAKQTAEADGLGMPGIWPNLCNLDSDNDGRTNGRELGDPACTWRFGQGPSSPTPPDGEIVTHPGIPDSKDGVATELTVCP